MNKLKIALKYIRHIFTARHTKGYGVHSPFLFNFVRHIIPENNVFYIYRDIEALRDKMLADKRQIDVKDYGTGSDRKRKVSDIASRSLKSSKYSQLLFRIAHHFNPQTILELGTSLGITTAYLASNSSKSRCITLEGCPQTARIARENFAKLQLNNIELVEGDINVTLQKVLESISTLDFVFVDANHSSAAVLNYFKLCLPLMKSNSVMVFDDIYWSDDMEMAWETIKKNEKVKATIDLFQVGIVFFNADLYKKDYKIRY